MKFEDVEINSIGELIAVLQEQTVDINLPIWFRGQADAEWPLNPRLMRQNPLPSESHYLNRFKQDALFILNRKPETEFEWLFLMQHHGISTRLLDWSESPLTALYFTLTSEAEKDGALWVLLPTELNRISNYKPDFAAEIPSFEDEHLQNYLPSTIAHERKSSLQPMAAIAPRNSQRMQSQQGVFTISHREIIPVENAGHQDLPKNHIWKFIVPSASKPRLLAELKLLGINKFKLFPELESLSENFTI